MIWRQHTTRCRLYPDYISSQYIIYHAYKDGHINWNVYQKAKERITSNRNGSWMFEKGSEQIDFSKVYCPAFDVLSMEVTA